MDYETFHEMLALSERRASHVPMALRRSLYGRINWENRLIALKGARGVGKTTLLLQHLRECLSGGAKALYVSLDNLWFSTHSLRDLVDFHVSRGGTALFLDEVHYMPEWQTTIKNLYDDYPELSIVYTGSSMLRISASQGDLSRRQVTYELRGLSFREFLLFEGICDAPALPLPELLDQHVALARQITSGTKILAHFDRYLTVGYYPFYLEPGDGYETRVRQMVNQILESDYPAIEEATPSTIRKVRRMLMLLSERPPQTPNLSALARELEIDRNHGLKMMYALERAGLLNLLEAEAASLKNLSRPEKIYCENPNLMHALVPSTDMGTLRECFALNQLRAAGRVTYPKQGDFLVDGSILFEVGGKGKTYGQIKDLPNSFLAVDNLEVGAGNRIPLWCLGFLY